MQRSPLLNVFLGYDHREHDAYLVAKHSIERRSSLPVLVSPLVAEHLTHLVPPPLPREGKFWDPESGAWAATEFARTRFCVPFIQKKGWALFADSDILVDADIVRLFGHVQNTYAVMVVKHQPMYEDPGVYDPQYRTTYPPTKMDGQIQQYYDRKNWSSVVLWNCDHPAHQRLTLDRLNNWPGRDLHAFSWLEDDEIGSLPPEWNYLVDAGPILTEPKLFHYTLGTPNMRPDSSWASLWQIEYEDATRRS